MILISYDIANDKVRARFQRLITKHGAIRLQYSVYEVRNTNRVMDNMKALIEHFSKNFSFADSVIIFSVRAATSFALVYVVSILPFSSK